MTKFIKDNFRSAADSLHYDTSESDRPYRFVARFKYARSGKSTFTSFLIKNFTVEEYFSRLAAGEAPLKIVESKGYLQPHVKKMLKELGYPVSVSGRDKYISDTVAKYSKA